MASMTDYLEGQIRAHIFRTASFTKPTILAVALFTAATTDAGGGTEVTGGAYARVNVPPLDANWTAPDATGGATSNVAVITFPTATAAWGTVSHVAIFDALTVGNMLFHGALTTAQAVNNGNTFSFAANQLSITFA